MEALYKAGDRFQSCSDFYFRTILRDIKNLVHINLTLQTTTKNSLSRAGFELAPSGF